MHNKIAKDLQRAVEEAARKLSDNNRKVYLENPFGGLFVTIDSPEDKLKENSELTKFRETNIDRNGEFYLVIERWMGRKTEKIS